MAAGRFRAESTSIGRTLRAGPSRADASYSPGRRQSKKQAEPLVRPGYTGAGVVGVVRDWTDEAWRRCGRQPGAEARALRHDMLHCSRRITYGERAVRARLRSAFRVPAQEVLSQAGGTRMSGVTLHRRSIAAAGLTLSLSLALASTDFTHARAESFIEEFSSAFLRRRHHRLRTRSPASLLTRSAWTS
jgi:hypothetical protein